MSSTQLGYVLIILSAAAFASTSLFLKIALGVGMDAWSYTLCTSVFAIIALGLMSRRASWPRKWPSGLLLFAVFGAVAAIAFNNALAYISISLGTILLFTYPAFVALGAWLVLGQRPTAWHGGALVLTLVGAALTANTGDAMQGAVNWLGIGLALLAAVAHGSYLVLGERYTKTLSATAATAITRGAILLSVLALRPQVVSALPTLSWQAWAICLLSSGIGGVAPFLLLNKGIGLIGANRAAIASVVELPIALAIGLAFQGDLISPIQWAGAVLIGIAVLLSQKQA